MASAAQIELDSTFVEAPPSFVELTDLTEHVHGPDGAIRTVNFLDLNRNLLPVLGRAKAFCRQHYSCEWI